MDSIILDYLSWTRPLGYLLIFLGMTFEGDVLLFSAAFLTHQGFFDLGDMIVVVLGGVFIGDLCWYWVGFRFGKSSSFLHRWIEHITFHFQNHLMKRPFHTLLFSKFLYGIHHAILLYAGEAGFNLKKFMKYDAIAIVIWVFGVGGLGYASSASFALLRGYLRFTEVAVALGLGIFFLFEYIVRRYSKRTL